MSADNCDNCGEMHKLAALSEFEPGYRLCDRCFDREDAARTSREWEEGIARGETWALEAPQGQEGVS